MRAFEPVGRLLFAEGEAGTAQISVFGIPYDASTSFRPGARFGPEGIRAASVSLETFSPLQDAEVRGGDVADLGDVAGVYGGPERVLGRIEGATGEVLGKGSFPFALGGDHLVTAGEIRALADRHPDLAIFHIDAHTDFRESYMGEPLSHASVMRRCRELLPHGGIYQFGIRSGPREEFREGDYLSPTLEGLSEAVREIGARPAFLTFDIDAFDPSEAPGTGTPEPGGLTWREVAAALPLLSDLHWVGADVVEVAPPFDPTGRTAVLAAKLVRELLILFQRSD